MTICFQYSQISNLKMLFICLLLIPTIIPCMGQEKVTLPRFIEFRTTSEIENEEWMNKITDEKEVGNYILQLVSSKEKLDYTNKWICVQVLDKSTRQFIQEIDLEDMSGRGDYFLVDDFNFDGHEEFALWFGFGSSDNSYSIYFLFDPETKTFLESEFEGSNLEFHSHSKTILSSYRYDAGAKIMYQTYRVIDNKMVLIEEQYLSAVMIEDEESGEISFMEDKEGCIVFEEEHCDTNIKTIELDSTTSVSYSQIMSREYFTNKMEAPAKPSYLQITDYSQMKEKLSKHFRALKKYDEEYDKWQDAGVEITYNDGVKKVFDWMYDLETHPDLSFKFYPELDIVIIEGEAGGNYIIDLNNSCRKSDDIGNPALYAPSPDKQWRISGYDPGGAYDTLVWRLDKWNPKAKKYDKVLDFEECRTEEGNYFFPQDIKGWFWIDNNTAFFRDEHKNGKFYKLELIKRHDEK